MPSYRVLQTPFPFDKRRLAKGEVFEVNEKLGALFVKQGRAEPAEMLAPVDLPAEVMSRASKREPTTETEEVVPKAVAPLSYQTRHMEAEKPALTIQPVGPAVPVELDEAPKKRGRPHGSKNK